MKDTILQLHKLLIRIPSVSSDIEKLNEIIDFVENEFSDYKDAIIKKYEFSKKPSIVVQNFEGLEADIILNGHLDVVPPSEENQFEPVYKDGKIYARGAGDMKAGDAIMITLMKEIFENNFTDKKVSLILTTDEEVWGENGAAEIVKLWYTASMGVLIPDSGSIEKITIAHKGIIDISVEVRGKSGHSSRPWSCENAIEKTYQLYNDLKSHIEDQTLLTEENSYWGSTVQLTTIEWWTATNVIPEVCKVHFNIRITERFQDTLALKKELEKIINSYGKITEYSEGALAFTDENNSFIQSYLRSCESVLRFTPILEREHWATDGRYFASEGMPMLLHLPTCKNIHSRGEYVEETAIFQIYDCYKTFIFWEKLSNLD